MKRRALLIGNTRGLAGVQADMQKTRAFLGSRVGGIGYLLKLLNSGTRAAWSCWGTFSF